MKTLEQVQTLSVLKNNIHVGLA